MNSDIQKSHLIALCLFLLICANILVHNDSPIELSQQISLKYISAIDTKVQKNVEYISPKIIKSQELIHHKKIKINYLS